MFVAALAMGGGCTTDAGDDGGPDGAGPTIPTDARPSPDAEPDSRPSAPDATNTVDASADGRVDAALASSVDIITFNWPARYGPTSGVDAKDELLWDDLSAKASVMSLQEAGWIAGWIAGRGWRVHRPNPSGDDDNQPVGNLLVWDPAVWEQVAVGAYAISPRTRIQEEAAGPTYHRPKYVVWAKLRNRADGRAWVFGSVHFVPSKHLGGAALVLWRLQRDNMLAWWGQRGERTIVAGDFNAQPGDAVAQPIWEVARRQTAVSHGNRKIDWIVRKRSLTGPAGIALGNRGQSDHKPVLGHVEWQP